MRENRPHGSEGGGAGTTGPSYPYEALWPGPTGNTAARARAERTARTRALPAATCRRARPQWGRHTNAQSTTLALPGAPATPVRPPFSTQWRRGRGMRRSSAKQRLILPGPPSPLRGEGGGRRGVAADRLRANVVLWKFVCLPQRGLARRNVTPSPRSRSRRAGEDEVLFGRTAPHAAASQRPSPTRVAGGSHKRSPPERESRCGGHVPNEEGTRISKAPRWHAASQQQRPSVPLLLRAVGEGGPGRMRRCLPAKAGWHAGAR